MEPFLGDQGDEELRYVTRLIPPSESLLWEGKIPSHLGDPSYPLMMMLYTTPPLSTTDASLNASRAVPGGETLSSQITLTLTTAIRFH